MFSSPCEKAGSDAYQHLDELRGHVAVTANHCKDSRLRRELDALFARLTTEIDRYDDGQ